jgi:UDP-glucose 4-epimerase
LRLAIVTGANGAIGQTVVGELTRANWRVAGVGHGPVQWIAPQGIDYWIAGDVNGENLNVLADRVGEPDLIINLAGGSAVGPSLVTPLSDFDRTVNTTAKLLNWMWTHTPKAKLVYISSAAVYGGGHVAPIPEDTPATPLSPYGHHKYLAEELVRYWARQFDIASAIIRPFSVYGPGLRKQLIFELCRKLNQSDAPLILSGTGQEERDWVEISDVARMIVGAAAHASTATPTFNASSGVGTTIKDTVAALIATWGDGRPFSFDGCVRASDPAYLVGSAQRLEPLGLSATIPLAEGLTKTVRAFRAKEQN